MQKIRLLYALEATGGGALKHLAYLVSNIDKAVFDISVALSDQRTDSSQADILKIKDSGAKIIKVPMRKEISLVADCRAFLKICRVLRSGDYDILHAHSSKAGGLFRLAAVLCGMKQVLYTPHCFYFQSKTGFAQKIFIGMERLLASVTSYIIVSENEQQNALLHKIAKPFKLQNINNAIKFNDYQEKITDERLLSDFEIPPGSFIVGAVGRLTPQKDWETFVFAANEVLKKYPEAVFLISGEGELETDIRKLIFSLGLEKSILLTGYVSEIYKIFGIIDLFVSTSLWEGLPYVILEAMKYNKPVIATDTGNGDLVVHNINGFVTPVKDYRTIAEKICELIANKQKAQEMGRKGYELLTRKYSFELFIQKHETLYRKLVY